MKKNKICAGALVFGMCFLFGAAGCEKKQERPPLPTLAPTPTPKPAGWKDEQAKEPTAKPTPTKKPASAKESTPTPVPKNIGTVDMLLYDVVGGKEITITGITDNTIEEIAIPETISELPVTVIGKSAFERCTELTAVTLPEGVKSLEEDAFFLCRKLETINFPESLEKIGQNAFAYCFALKEAKIPKNVSLIEEWVFRGCDSITEYQVDEENKNYIVIDGALFTKDKKTLLQYPAGKKSTEYTVPDGVTRIGSGAFERCMELKKLNFPDSLESIGKVVFNACISLEKLTLPRKLKEFDGNSGIGSCESLQEIEVASGNRYFVVEDGILYSKDKKTLVAVPQTKDLTGYQLPKSVVTIGMGAFNYNSTLTELEFQKNVRTIESSAFQMCVNLEKIVIPSGVKTIADTAFTGCEKLTIYTKKGSAAESFAKEHDIPVELL